MNAVYCAALQFRTPHRLGRLNTSEKSIARSGKRVTKRNRAGHTYARSLAVEFLRRIIAFKMLYSDAADRPGHLTNRLESFLLIFSDESVLFGGDCTGMRSGRRGWDRKGRCP